MTRTTAETWLAHLARSPAVDLATFDRIVQDFLGPDGDRLPGALRRASGDRDSVERRLAETLLLHRELLAGPDAPTALRQAYLHYLVNTGVPLPDRPAPDFELLAWAREYAAAFEVDLPDGPGPDGALRLQVDDPVTPLPFDAAWQALGGGAQALRALGRQVNHRRYGRDDVIPSRLFAFDPAATRHHAGNAMWLADLAQLVYLRQGFVERQLRRWGFDSVSWIEQRDKDVDTQAVVAACDSHGVVAFRGTRGGTDILTDLKFRKKDFHPGPTGSPTGRVHRGFLRALDGVWGAVDEAVGRLSDARPGRPLFVCGHSLGAALATLAARRLVGHGRDVAGVYVYGSPRVGNDDFRDDYDRVLRARTFLHVNGDDVVTRVPPRWLGFQHVAGESRRFEASGHAFTVRPHDADDDGPQDGSDDGLRRDMDRLRESLSRSERQRDPRATPAASAYGAVFEDGAVDEHSIGEYLFKFACALVEERLNVA
jgi:triacylglycerol lipase